MCCFQNLLWLSDALGSQDRAMGRFGLCGFSVSTGGCVSVFCFSVLLLLFFLSVSCTASLAILLDRGGPTSSARVFVFACRYACDFVPVLVWMIEPTRRDCFIAQHRPESRTSNKQPRRRAPFYHSAAGLCCFFSAPHTPPPFARSGYVFHRLRFILPLACAGRCLAFVVGRNCCCHTHRHFPMQGLYKEEGGML